MHLFPFDLCDSKKRVKVCLELYVMCCTMWCLRRLESCEWRRKANEGKLKSGIRIRELHKSIQYA